MSNQIPLSKSFMRGCEKHRGRGVEWRGGKREGSLWRRMQAYIASSPEKTFQDGVPKGISYIQQEREVLGFQMAWPAESQKNESKRS